MMLFDYRCNTCGEEFERDFPIGKAEREVPCPSCDAASKKLITSASFVLKGGGWASRTNSMNSEQTRKNAAAGKRMRKEHKPGVNLIAYDYGNGDVRGVKDG